jgi:hypothetical protein
MKQRILKIVSDIKHNITVTDVDPSLNELLDDIYEQLTKIEDEIYTDDVSDIFADEDEDY